MNPFLPIIAVVLFSFSLAPKAANAGQPRITILSHPDSHPPALSVIDILGEHLSDLDIGIDPWEVETLPTNQEAWLAEAGNAAKEAPGTIALFGYICTDTTCSLLAIEPRGRVIMELPIKIPEDEDTTTAFAIAATFRETLIGPLFPELKRLVYEGEHPSPPPPSPDSVWFVPPLEQERKRVEEQSRPWLWLEGGYNGDHSHPDGFPIHGPWVGVVLEPRKEVGVTLSFDWLGIHEGNVPTGTISTHRFTSSLGLRVSFPLGPARIAITPMGRLDVVFVETDPFEEPEKNKTEVDIQAGGIVTWHLPLKRHLEAVIGAGVLATALSRDHKIDDANAIPASTLRLIWLAGISWSPL